MVNGADGQRLAGLFASSLSSAIRGSSNVIEQALHIPFGRVLPTGSEMAISPAFLLGCRGLRRWWRLVGQGGRRVRVCVASGIPIGFDLPEAVRRRVPSVLPCVAVQPVVLHGPICVQA